jgi:phosphoglycerol transferase
LTLEASLPPESPGPSLREHGLAQALCLVLLVGLFRLWQADLRVPFAYEGDAFFTLMLTKGGIDAGWYFTNPWLGAPFRLEMFDHPVAGTLHFALLKLFSLLTRDACVSVNLYYLLGYSLCTFSALSVLRRLGLSAVPALVGALLFAFLPYHLVRGEGHLFLASYYSIPPGILLVHWVATGRLRVRWPLERRALSALAILVLLASTSIYYSFFTGVLFLVHGVAAARRLRTPGARRVLGLELRMLATTFLLGAALASAFAANIAPNLVSMAVHGRNREVVKRSQVESETFGLRLGSLVMPVAGHRLAPMRELRERYDGSAGSAEGSSSALGVWGATGFTLLLWALFRRRRDQLCRFLSESNLVLVLLGVTGGVGSLVALFVTPLIRAYNRVSVVIGFLALALIMRLLQGCLPRVQARLKIPYAGAALFGAVLLLGVLDQTNPEYLPNHVTRRATFEADRAFVRAIESELPPGASLFVLPYLAFPEAVDRIAVNELFRGYMHSRSLRFSAGAMNGTYAALWQEDVASEPPATMVETLSLAGFHGIYVDRRGVADARALEAALSPLLGKPRSNAAGDLQFFSLVPVTARLQGTPAWADRQSVTRRVAVRWSGFYAKERAGARTWRWSAGKSEIHLVNPDDEPRNVHVRMTLYAISPRVPRLHISGAARASFDLVKSRPVFETTLSVPQGGAKLIFESDGKPGIPAGDTRLLAFAVEDFTAIASE